MTGWGDEERPYRCEPPTPADMVYIALGLGVLLVLAALAYGAIKPGWWAI